MNSAIRRQKQLLVNPPQSAPTQIWIVFLPVIFLYVFDHRLDSLCCAEGHLKVLPAVCGTEAGVIEGLWKEVMHQSAESHPVTPAGGEVLDVHILHDMKETEAIWRQRAE